MYRNSNVLVYSVRKFDQECIDQITAQILEDWVKLQAKDYSYQPMNISTLPFIDQYLLENNQVNREKLEAVKKIYQLSGFPIWIARTGKCSKPFPLMRSLRI